MMRGSFIQNFRSGSNVNYGPLDNNRTFDNYWTFTLHDDLSLRRACHDTSREAQENHRKR